MQAVSELLEPIAPSDPSGVDMSFSPELDAITEARRFDDPTLDQGEWVTDLKEADWGFVAQRCAALLATKSKDLRLAVWYAEAGAKTRQFRGLGDGFLLVAGLCDQFWTTLHPLGEDGDEERKIGNLSWLLARAVHLVREIPLTEGAGTAFSSLDFDAARARATTAERLGADAPITESLPKLATMEAARRKSSGQFYQRLLADSAYCLDALLAMEKSIDARLGVDGPGFSAVKGALDTVMRLIARFAAEAGVKGAPAATDNVSPTEANAIAADRLETFGKRLQSRAQALAQLRAVAEFFRQTEPHSPVAYLADKAANWGELPLHDWLRTVIKDSASLAHVEELLGLQVSTPPE